MDLNEEILNQTLSALYQEISNRKLEASLWKMIPEEKVKSLIESYNYNSFGHYGFTRLLFYLMASCPNHKS